MFVTMQKTASHCNLIDHNLNIHCHENFITNINIKGTNVVTNTLVPA
jgi:hypothetical protein